MEAGRLNMVVTERRLTLEEFLALPERKPALEFEDGVVTRKVTPKMRHSALQVFLVKRIDTFAMPRQLARAFSELRTTFAGASRVPDVAVFVWDRIPTDATGRLVDDVFEPPDIAIEIVSPKQGVNTLVRRCLRYAQNGVRMALLVDPNDESVIVFRPDAPDRALRGADVIDFGEIIHGFELAVRELFEALRGR
jgi:Uma2 family endonuclease